MGKLKFGVFLPFYVFQTKNCPPQQQYSLIQQIVLESEKLGYESIWLDDHLMYGNWPILECSTTLAALAAATNSIRLGTMVNCIAHQNPVLLAKTDATLDVISNGRLEVGVGAGCQETEHLAYGFNFPKPSVRVERLSEALEVMTKLWTQQKANYQGKHYVLKDAVCLPKPLQKPYPPITVGGSGKKTLKVTAKYADRFDWGSLPIDEYRDKLVVLEEQCRTFGRDFGEIERSCWPGGQVLVAQSQEELDELVSKGKPAGLPMEEYRRGNLFGTPARCLQQLQSYRDLGVTYFMLFFADLPRLDSLRLFAKEVAGKLV